MQADSPLAILNRRLASGEISIEEFERLKVALNLEPTVNELSTQLPAESETEAQRMLRRQREWQEKNKTEKATILTLADSSNVERISTSVKTILSGDKVAGIDKRWLIGGAAGVCGLVLLAASSGGPSCEISDVKSKTEMLYLNGFDYGVIVSAYVKNTGSNGMLNIEALLSTSEGSFQRVRPYMIGKDQTSRVEFQFNEPSINVNPNDLQAVVNCSSS